MNVRATVIAITILILPSLAAAANRAHPAAAVGSLAGKVLSNGAPVASATINVWHEGKQMPAVAVTADGFRVSVPEGTYEVEASAPHYRPEAAARITVVVHADHETWVNLMLVAVP